MAYDTSVIRPEMRVDQVKARGAGLARDRRTAIRKGLRTLHTLEIMATNIYKCQITSQTCELNTQLTAAMCNEMTHMQDFQTKLYEYGFKPSKIRWAYWMVGYAFGLGSRALGPRRILKTGVWVETKAVDHYTELLLSIDWDDDTRAFIEKDHADEHGHIERWKSLLADPEAIC